MRRIAALALALALPATALADYESAAKRAEKLASLREFLEKYVGSCNNGDQFDKQDCKRNVEATRRKLTGKTFAVRIGDAGPGSTVGDCRGGGACVLLLPFFDGGGGFGLSRGAPKGKDKNGNPIFDLLPLPTNPDADPDDVARAARTGMMSVEIVFEPQGVWSMPRKDGTPMEGVKAKLVAVRVVNARGGEVIAESD